MEGLLSTGPTPSSLLRGEASCWRVCYQRGLPRLVLLLFCFFVAPSFTFTGSSATSLKDYRLKSDHLSPGWVQPQLCYNPDSVLLCRFMSLATNVGKTEPQGGTLVRGPNKQYWSISTRWMGICSPHHTTAMQLSRDSITDVTPKICFYYFCL